MLHQWAIDNRIPFSALQDLHRRMGMLVDQHLPAPAPAPGAGRSEAAISNLTRLDASRKGMRLFRNNVGALKDERGVPVRYGLANDTPALNKVLKSHDLIGWETLTVNASMVGTSIARFLSVETKEEGWYFTGTPRERAQQSWADLVNSCGGRALFVSSENAL